ncbi:MAG TPA: hypothetical protein PKI49_08285 [Pseudomonadota bacterium]|nr:hypothetical protein [Pseudomonadota bacterium]HNK47232.1 hypothetical protein [Pseudomonadota bacterium]HNN54049.1 hypothetical protein [Pseudomonadota bacterium]HNO68495.1 hypothetical protein [Pseudomonadota bacterium]
MSLFRSSLVLNKARWGLLLPLLLWFSGCSEVNVDAVPGAAAGCEAPSEDNLVPQAPMLPGRDCLACHVAGSQAGDLPWTAGGTVYASGSSTCNTGGLEGVKVELADETRKVLITLTTNRAGNFFTAEKLLYQTMIARVSKDGKVKEMTQPVTTGNCASCHRPGGAAGGRIYLN